MANGPPQTTQKTQKTQTTQTSILRVITEQDDHFIDIDRKSPRIESPRVQRFRTLGLRPSSSPPIQKEQSLKSLATTNNDSNDTESRYWWSQLDAHDVTTAAAMIFLYLYQHPNTTTQNLKDQITKQNIKIDEEYSYNSSTSSTASDHLLLDTKSPDQHDNQQNYLNIFVKGLHIFKNLRSCQQLIDITKEALPAMVRTTVLKQHVYEAIINTMESQLKETKQHYQTEQEQTGQEKTEQEQTEQEQTEQKQTEQEQAAITIYKKFIEELKAITTEPKAITEELIITPDKDILLAKQINTEREEKEKDDITITAAEVTLKTLEDSKTINVVFLFYVTLIITTTYYLYGNYAMSAIMGKTTNADGTGIGMEADNSDSTGAAILLSTMCISSILANDSLYLQSMQTGVTKLIFFYHKTLLETKDKHKKICETAKSALEFIIKSGLSYLLNLSQIHALKAATKLDLIGNLPMCIISIMVYSFTLFRCLLTVSSCNINTVKNIWNRINDINNIGGRLTYASTMISLSAAYTWLMLIGVDDELQTIITTYNLEGQTKDIFRYTMLSLLGGILLVFNLDWATRITPQGIYDEINKGNKTCKMYCSSFFAVIFTLMGAIAIAFRPKNESSSLPNPFGIELQVGIGAMAGGAMNFSPVLQLLVKIKRLLPQNNKNETELKKTLIPPTQQPQNIPLLLELIKTDNSDAAIITIICLYCIKHEVEELQSLPCTSHREKERYDQEAKQVHRKRNPKT